MHRKNARIWELDALRGFAVYFTRPAAAPEARQGRIWSADMWEDYNSASGREKNYLKTKYGDPNENEKRKKTVAL